MSTLPRARLAYVLAPATGELFRSAFRDHAARVVVTPQGFAQQVLKRVGSQQAIDNARFASTELSRRRVEREAVDLFLERFEVRGLPVPENRAHVATLSTPRSSSR